MWQFQRNGAANVKPCFQPCHKSGAAFMIHASISISGSHSSRKARVIHVFDFAAEILYAFRVGHARAGDDVGAITSTPPRQTQYARSLRGCSLRARQVQTQFFTWIAGLPTYSTVLAVAQEELDEEPTRTNTLVAASLDEELKLNSSDSSTSRSGFCIA